MTEPPPHDRTGTVANRPEPPAKPRRQIAVALEYDKARDALPRVVASGRGATAEQILELAFANGVRVREDADLAEILAAIDLDTEIPVEAIAAVAEILIHVYRANGKLSAPAEALAATGPASP